MEFDKSQFLRPLLLHMFVCNWFISFKGNFFPNCTDDTTHYVVRGSTKDYCPNSNQ